MIKLIFLIMIVGIAQGEIIKLTPGIIFVSELTINQDPSQPNKSTKYRYIVSISNPKTEARSPKPTNPIITSSVLDKINK